MNRCIRCALTLLCLFPAWPAAAQAPAKPRLELGLGIAALVRPDYRGSTQSSTTVLPVPYLTYHSDRLQFSREGLMARLFNTESLRLGLSMSASLPGNDDNPQSLRRGMPEILPTWEAGPSLDWQLGQAGGQWTLRLPVRAVAAADLKEFEGIGWLISPQLHFDRRQRLGDWQVDTAGGVGPLWASRKYHRYFYRVEPQFATAERPAYDPEGGYSGARAAAYLGLRRGPWRIGLGVTHDVLAGSAMRDSPLVETQQATVVALGIFRVLWASEAAPP